MTARDEATALRVEALAAYGITHAAIARLFGIGIEDLREAYPDELDNGATKANSRVAESLYRKATSDSREGVAAAIFWLKARAGWKETHAHQLTGGDGGPIRTEARFDFSLLSRDDRDVLRGMLTRAMEQSAAQGLEAPRQ